MGSVWSAHNEMTERKFALKVMNREAALDPSAVQRFLQEARAAGSLRHPAIVEVYDVGYHDWGRRGSPTLPYLVMELLEGETLEQRLARTTLLPPAEVVHVVHAIASGLSVAHDAGIVHRDLKPANLFFHGPAQTPKVLDFGISKLLGVGASDGVLTVTGLVLGSPPYMSPEQAGGKLDVDARSDVWALGVIAYRALSGALPFAAPNYNALMLEIIHTQPTPIQTLCAGLDAKFAAIVMSCLAKDRQQRPATAGELARLLDALSESGSGPTTVELPAAPASRSRLSRFALLGALLALAALAAQSTRLYLLRANPIANPEADREGKTLTSPGEPGAAAVETSKPPQTVPTFGAESASPPRKTVPDVGKSSAAPIRGANRALQPRAKPRPLASAGGRDGSPKAVGNRPSPVGPPPVSEGVTSPGL